MTPDEAIEAIQKAVNIHGYVPTATSHEGAHLNKTFRISKEEAIAAMNEVRDTEYVPKIDISDDGLTVTIGKTRITRLEENFSHFENNNGNF